MAWTTPTICELACGMEINMYAPADEGDSEDTLF
ncbi:MAG: pyrroloquinoline quinone precursor peptide PqqA [Pseudomonadota bacterium]